MQYRSKTGHALANLAMLSSGLG